MKKLILWVLSLLWCGATYAQSENDSSAGTIPATENKTEIQGMVLLTNNAFAPIPAFSFDASAFMTFLSIGRKHFKYEPEFSAGLNGRPWMWDNWLRFSFINKPVVQVTAGVNPNLFFISSKTEDNQDLLESHRSITGEIMATFQNSRKNTKYIFTYRYNQAFDFGTVSGHSIDTAVELPGILGFNRFYINLRPQLFYFNADDGTDGFYAGNIVQIGRSKSSFLFAYQSVQSIRAGFLPKPKYNHSFSVLYLF